MGKSGKGLLALGILLAGTLLTLRITGLEPEYMDYTTEEYNQRGRMTLPGLWLTGEVVSEPVSDWDWVLDVAHPVRGNTIMLETRTWYGIPYSVTILPTPRGAFGLRAMMVLKFMLPMAICFSSFLRHASISDQTHTAAHLKTGCVSFLKL